jgi:hypothetical protein
VRARPQLSVYPGVAEAAAGVALADGYEPTLELADAVLVRKTIASAVVAAFTFQMYRPWHRCLDKPSASAAPSG